MGTTAEGCSPDGAPKLGMGIGRREGAGGGRYSFK